MTDSEKLDLLLEKTTRLEEDVTILKSDVKNLKSNVNHLKLETKRLKADTKSLKADIIPLQKFMVETKMEFSRLNHYSDLILDEVERVHRILDDHKADKSVHIA